MRNNNEKRTVRSALYLLASVSTVAAAQSPAIPDDPRVEALARSRGCYLCHTSLSVRQEVSGRLPRAPAWQSIAQEYRGRPDAEERLARTVLSGMGHRLEDQHWRGRVALADMPPNDYQLSATEARDLVRWVLRF